MVTKHVNKFYCQHDGGQWNVPVEIIHSFEQLHVVRGLTSDLIGTLGADGNTYLLVPDCDLYDREQP